MNDYLSKSATKGKNQLSMSISYQNKAILDTDSDYYKDGVHIFAASWCDHCKQMRKQNKQYKPAILKKRHTELKKKVKTNKDQEKASSMMQITGRSPTRIWWHQIGHEPQFAPESFGIDGYPSVRFFKNGDMKSIDDCRDINLLVKQYETI